MLRAWSSIRLCCGWFLMVCSLVGGSRKSPGGPYVGRESARVGVEHVPLVDTNPLGLRVAAVGLVVDVMGEVPDLLL